jgi:hypothetical protein
MYVEIYGAPLRKCKYAIEFFHIPNETVCFACLSDHRQLPVIDQHVASSLQKRQEDLVRQMSVHQLLATLGSLTAPAFR